MLPARMASAPGDPFGWVGATADGKYQVEECVGEGGFGVVYRAKHLGFGEMVAFKCLRVPEDLKDEDRERFFESFMHEGKLQHQLSRMTAGIVQALDVGAVNSPNGTWTPYLVLEWLQGRTLEEDMDDRHQLGMRGRPVHEAIALLDPVARALELAHEQGVAHRDVKPANLFLATIGGRQTIKVLDFGIAKVITETASVSQAFEATGRTLQAFTAHYGAPEQFARRFGATGPWTDVFALALVFIELVSGQRALEGDDAAELFVSAADSQHRPTLRARGVETSDAVEAVLKTALSVDPKVRYRTMAEFWEALIVATGYVPRAPMASAHTALVELDARTGPPASGLDLEKLMAPTVVPGLKKPTPVTLDAKEPALPGGKTPDTQLSSTSQVSIEPARPPVEAPRRGITLIAGVAAMSLLVGGVVGGVGYVLKTRGAPKAAASVSASAASLPSAMQVASASASVDGPPAESASPTAKAAELLPAPLPRAVPAGVVPGTSVWLEEFKLQMLPADTGKAVLDAQTRCADAGLALCTEQQWARACAESPDLGREPSWTLTGQTHGFVVRGGGACTIRAVAPGSSSAPDRHGICCERSVAVESSNSNRTFVVATSRQLEKIEAALNSRRSSVFLALVADGTAIDGEAKTLTEIGKMLDDSHTRYPDQWTVLDTCSVSMKVQSRPPKLVKRGKKKMRTPGSSSWSAECEVLRQRGGDVSVVTTSYLIGGNGRLMGVEDIRTSRAWSKP